MDMCDLDEVIVALSPHLNHPDHVIALLVRSVREIATHLRDAEECRLEQLEREDG